MFGRLKPLPECGEIYGEDHQRRSSLRPLYKFTLFPISDLVLNPRQARFQDPGNESSTFVGFRVLENWGVLKQGSTRLETSSETEGEENLSSSSSHVFSSDTQLGDTHDAMAIDSCESLKQLKNKNPSVLSMFSRYKNLAQAQNSTTET
ncbi:unnamed protein product [Arabidopsis halleri]